MPQLYIPLLLKTHGKCGKKCLDCELFRGYCPGCITRDCLVAKCKRGTTYVGITHPKEFCTIREYCSSLGRIHPSVKIQDMPRLRVKSTTNLPTFVPVISLIDKKSWFWQDIPLRWVAVRLAELVKNRTLLQTVSSEGLHSFLGFEGDILLSTVMEDELLEKLAPRDYLEIIKNVRPDMTMTPDVYTYLDDPLCLSWQQTMRSVEFATSFSELDIPVIGMIKGALENQIGWSAEKQFQLGCRLFALPCRELARLDLIDNVVMTIMRALHSSESDIRILLYGLSYPLMKSKERFVYSGLSWFLSARKGLYFRGVNSFFLTDTDVRFEECDCDACKGRSAYELKEDRKSLALHNLLQTIQRLDRWDQERG